ncbi:MAG: hypothetical protein J2P35_13900 [Actinobacteria bacterium]|nr:hypothetical protein [Actinomycetota bacterium]
MAAACWRLARDPRAYLVAGALLMAGSAVAAAVTWPPSMVSIRPFGVGAILILRGAALGFIRRYRRSAPPPASRAGGRLRWPSS